MGNVLGFLQRVCCDGGLFFVFGVVAASFCFPESVGGMDIFILSGHDDCAGVGFYVGAFFFYSCQGT